MQGWFEQALIALRNSGPIGQRIVKYARQRRIPLDFSRQRSTGASWFDWRGLRFGVFLTANYAGARPDIPQLCALLAHEVKHLQQGVREALSVRGELVAWQVQYDVLAQSSAAPSDQRWRLLRALDPGSRADLKVARALMKEISGPGYHIDWLPLWPLPAEVVYRLRDLGRRILNRVKA